jgi:Zn-dependent protease with chaperone function
MNFFQQQEQARNKTRWLVLVYIIAVIAIVIALDAVFLVVKGFGVSEYPLSGNVSEIVASNQNTLLMFSLGIILFIGLASLYRMLTLRGGGGKVASALGGTRVDSRHPDRRVKQLVNIVEEMAVASGLPVPQVYVLEQESGINAFAAGNQPEDAAVAVTRGALEIFSRDEMQGVIGHEFSHILNGDMRLNMRLLGPLFGITLIGMMGNMLLRSSRRVRVRSSRESSGGVLAVLLLGAGLAVIGYIGQLAGRLIKAAISRQREYLADASAVQFTRQRDGIGGALKKIAAWQHGSVLTEPGAEEVSHMLFANGLKNPLSSLLATHPPIPDRLQRMGMKLKQDELARLAKQITHDIEITAAGSADINVESVAGFTEPLMAGEIATDQALKSARAVITHVPAKLYTDVESGHTVREVVIALLLSADVEHKRRQIQIVRDSGVILDEARILINREMLDSVSDGLRLPVLDLAFPALRQLTFQQQLELYELIERIIPTDGEISSFEYMLSRLLLQMLLENRRPNRTTGERRLKLSRLHNQLRALFSIVAVFGHDSEEAYVRAYNAGMQNLFGSQDWPRFYLPADWTPLIDSALVDLDRARPLIKEEIINSLMVTIAHDRDYRIEEYEMLRVISALLHCPMPLLDGDRHWHLE